MSAPSLATAQWNSLSWKGPGRRETCVHHSLKLRPGAPRRFNIIDFDWLCDMASPGRAHAQIGLTAGAQGHLLTPQPVTRL